MIHLSMTSINNAPICGSCCHPMDMNGIDCPTCEREIADELKGGIKFRQGTTRYVVLVGRWAVKFPTFKYGYRNFLRGLLGNIDEAGMGRGKDARLAPALFALPGGWLLVMPRCKPVSPREFHDLVNMKSFDLLPVEDKRDSFGWYKGRIVAIDYASAGSGRVR